MRLKVDRLCKGVLPHVFVDGALLATRGNALVRSSDLGESWSTLARVYSDRRAVSAGIRSIDRFVHHSPSVVLPHDSGLLAFCRDGVRHLLTGASSFVALDSPIDFRPMRRGVCSASSGMVYVGEYRHNGGEERVAPRDPVHIHRWDGNRWDIAWTFPEDTVRHVHAIVEHPLRRGEVYVCTGDTDSESVIWRTTNAFATLTPWISEGQASRACDLQFVGDDLLWGIDSPLMPSAICRHDGTLRRLEETPGPVYFGGRNEAGELWFGTSVEAGPSVKTDQLHVFASMDGGESFHDCFQRTADKLPQLSVVHIPSGVVPGDYVVVYLRATWRWEGCMVVGRLCR